jgi:hypothetical protein
MRDVFLSYSHDDRLRAERFHDAIIERQWTVWRDVVDLLPGQSWNDVIEKELTDAGVVLVLWSKNAVNSKWVRDEAELGLQLGKLVPVSLDGQMPKLGMRQIQFEDMSSWDGVDAEHPGLIRVLTGIREILKKGPPIAPKPIVRQTPSSVTRYAMIGAGLVTVLASGIVAIPYLTSGKTPPPPTPREAPSSAVDPLLVEKPSAPRVDPSKAGKAAKPANPPVITPKLEATKATGITPVTTTATAAPGCAALIAEARKRSDVAAVFFDLGKCHYGEGRFDDAVSAYNSAIELNDNQPKYFEALGLAKWKNNLAAQGIKDVTSAITLSSPDDPNLHSLFESRGKIHLATRDYQRAQDDYGKATRLNPKSKSAWLGLADAAEKNMSLDIAASARANADAIP